MTGRVSLLFEPIGHRMQVSVGTPLSDAIREAGIDFAYPCGGARICGRCRVTFRKGAPEPTDEERRMLAFEDIESGTRLACCCKVTAEAVVELPGMEDIHTEHVLTEGVRSDVVVDPEVRKFCCELPESTLEHPLSDWSRVVQSLPDALRREARPTHAVLRLLPGVVRCAEENGNCVTLTMRRNRVIHVECGDSATEHYGVAVDLGTTTLSAALVDLHSGTELARSGSLNPQRSFGHDLISRIKAVQDDPKNLELMYTRVVEAIGSLVTRMCEERGVDAKKVSAMAVAGNTVMSHLFLNIDPTSLGRAPFAGTLRAGVRLEARELNIPIHPHAPIYVLPCMGGFIGGDITAGILVTRLEDQPGVSVLVDIGTNGEVVVARDGELYSTSSAAGPSFEGGKISAGMIASEGAVHEMTFDGEKMTPGILGDGPAKGICGSGLIEVFARSVETGLIGMNGRIMRDAEAGDNIPEGLRSLLGQDDEGAHIDICPGGEGIRPVRLTQADVREFQLGKGAVQTAIRMVLDEMHIGLDEIDRFLVAGAFGRHLNLQDAMTLGLLPELPLDRVFFVGNSSLEGARCVLLNRYERERAERVAESTGFVELASRPEFQERFAMSMMLGPPMDL